MRDQKASATAAAAAAAAVSSAALSQNTEVAEEASSNLRAMNAKLETLLEESSSKLQSEQAAHSECRRRLEQLREAHRQEERIAASGHLQSDQHHQELRGLRERTMDQAEQIDVLVTEIAKLRSESQGSGSLILAHEEISRLQSEAKQFKSRIESLKQETASLHTTVEHLNSALASSAAAAAEKGHTVTGEPQVETDAGSFRSPPRHSKAGHVSWRGGGGDALLDPSVAGGGGTPVPVRFNARSADDVSLLLQERTAQVRLYQERAEKFESENDELRARLTDARDIENDIRQKLRDSDMRSAEQETEVKVLVERVERHRREKEEFEHKLEDKQVQLRSLVERLEAGEGKTREKDAQVWWSYVWHELKRQNAEDIMMQGSTKLDNADHDEDSLIKIASLKANLTAQAIELASLRQELLGRKLSFKSETGALKEQLDLAHRETIRLNALIRTHRGDKETRIAEMAATIRSLSARSEIHAQLASARQEFEAEKIASHHLRSDIDSYRNMLETESNKCALLRKELNLVQGQLDASAVLRTVTGVPGVAPAVLIEMMSGKIISLQAELTKGKGALAQAQAQINLQRTVAKRQVAPAQEAAGGAIKRTMAAPYSVPPQSLEAAEDHSHGLNRQATNQSQDSDPDASFVDSFSQPTIGAFSVVIDGECTPQKLLECMDVATLMQQVRSQESYITDLRTELTKFREISLQAENARLGDRDHYEDAYRIDAESSSQKLELMQITLDETKTEILALREENAAIQKALCDAQVASITSNSTPLVSSNLPAEWEARGGESVDSTFLDSDEVRQEFDKTKLLLRERTTQLKIVMETLDALHVAGIKEKYGDENAENLQIQGDLASLANAPLPSVEGSWGVQALVKRVVELTTELTSQCAVASLEERRANQLDEETKRTHRELNKQRSLLRTAEDAHAKMQSQIAILSERLKESDKLRTEQTSTYRREFDELLSAFREAEIKVTTSQVTINELRQQAALSDKDGFKEWIEHVLTDGTVPPTTHSDVAAITDEHSVSVRSLVSDLIKEWKFHVASYPQRSSKPGLTLSKSEQRFLQRVADLVSESDRRCNAATIAMRQAELKAEIAENTRKVTSEKLETALLHLHRYRKRSIALEKIVRSDSRFDITQSEKVKSHIRKALMEERRKFTECYSSLLILRRENKLNEMKKAFDSRKMLSMQHRIAELECKGSASLRGREEANHSIESRTKICEESMHRWFKTELPRLISGLPLTEDSMGFDFTSSVADFNVGLGAKNSLSVSSLGIDRTFALAQALCCSKASATVQDIKLQGALEKNSILKSRVIELEGVLSRWRSDIDVVEEKLAALSGEPAETGDAQDRVNAVITSSETESNLLDRIQQLTVRVLEVEEENIVATGRFEHALERSDEMKGLIDLLMKEEEVLKHKTIKQMAQMRSEFELHHAAELRNIREIYEFEKRELTDELEKVLGAVDVARATVEAVPRPEPSAQQSDQPARESSDDSDSLEESGSGRTSSAPLRPQASATLSAVDATDEVGNRIRSLLTQLSSTSRMPQKVDGGRQSRNLDAQDDSQMDRQSDVLELQREIDSLQSALETERVRSRQAKAEAFELEQLLNAQRAAFSDRIHGVIDSTSPNRHEPSSTRSASNSVASPHEHHSLNYHDTASSAGGGMLDMDANLWPTLGSLLDELNSCLQHLPTRYKALTNDSYLRTAMAMVARLKRVLANDADGFNIATPAPDEHPASPYEERGAAHYGSSITSSPGTPALQTLLDQVQVLENKFASERQPEKNIILLRDLRTRVAEIEVSMTQNFEKQKESWDHERAVLIQAIEDKTATIETLRLDQEEASAGIKARYEEALLQSQEALEQQTSAFTDRINILDDLQRHTQAQNEHLRQQLGEHELARARLLDQVASLDTEVENLNQKLMVETSPFVSAPLPPTPSPSTTLPVPFASTSAQLVSCSLEELLKLQRLVERANDDLETSNKNMRSLEEKHGKELGALRDLNLKLRRELEAKATATKASAVVKPGAAETTQVATKVRISNTVDERTQELEEQLRKIEYRFRSKNAEMEALVRSIARAGTNVSDTSFNYGGDSLDDDALSLPSNTDMSAIPPLLRSQLVEARLQAAESEVQSLQNLLSKEKREALHKTRLTKLAAAASSSSSSKEKDAPPNSPPRSKTPSRQKSGTPVRSPRKGSEANRGGDSIPVSVLIEKERLINEEIVLLRHEVTESRTQLQTLREEVTRKTRLITSLKAARQAESTAADHWRLEAQACEENAKRMHRSISAKDAIIKDLRAKIEAQAEESERDNAGQPQYSAIDASPPIDLKAKVKAAEIERSRIRNRLTIMRDRLSEAEAEIKELKERNEKLSKVAEKCDAHRNALARKEAQLRSVKTQLETQGAESQEALLESDKRIK